MNSLFGNALTNLYQSASNASKAAFNVVAKTTNEAANSLEHGYEYTKEKVEQGYEYTKEKVEQGYEYTKEKVEQGYEYTKENVEQGYEYTKDKANKTKDYVIKKYEDGKRTVKQQITAAKQAVDKVLKPQPAGAAIQGCPLQNKRDRVQARKQKISNSKDKLNKDKLNGMPDSQENKALDQATKRLERTNHDVELLRLANDTYTVNQFGEDGKRPPPPEGWERVNKADLRKLGFSPKDFPQLAPDFVPEEYGDGFYPELYKSKKDVFGEETYVLGLRGTQGKQDWTEGNAKQAAGIESKHYESAKNIGRSLKNALGPDKKLEVTGDSLGGGMATAVSIVAGIPGVTSDTAGVHPNTLGTYNRKRADQLVNNYHVKGEILTTVQEPAVQRFIMASGVALGGPAIALGLAAIGGRAIIEKGTLTYGAAGPMYEVPALANASEVANAAASGKSVQGMNPGLNERLDNDFNPLKKIEMHKNMDYVIAGVEQQKADDLAVINRILGR